MSSLANTITVDLSKFHPIDNIESLLNCGSVKSLDSKSTATV